MPEKHVTTVPNAEHDTKAAEHLAEKKQKDQEAQKQKAQKLEELTKKIGEASQGRPESEIPLNDPYWNNIQSLKMQYSVAETSTPVYQEKEAHGTVKQ